jgi:hypothetical protein
MAPPLLVLSALSPSVLRVEATVRPAGRAEPTPHPHTQQRPRPPSPCMACSPSAPTCCHRCCRSSPECHSRWIRFFGVVSEVRLPSIPIHESPPAVINDSQIAFSSSRPECHRSHSGLAPVVRPRSWPARSMSSRSSRSFRAPISPSSCGPSPPPPLACAPRCTTPFHSLSVFRPRVSPVLH